MRDATVTTLKLHSASTQVEKLKIYYKILNYTRIYLLIFKLYFRWLSFLLHHPGLRLTHGGPRLYSYRSLYLSERVFEFVNSAVTMSKKKKIETQVGFPTSGIIPGSWQPCWQDTAEELAGSRLLPCRTLSYQKVLLPFGTKLFHWRHQAPEPITMNTYFQN